MPQQFADALRSLRRVPVPAGIVCEETAAPPHLAAFSAAVSLQTRTQGGEQPLANSTLVILYDPDQCDIWGGPFRLVGHMRTQIDAAMSEDPLLPDIMWVGLLEALSEYASDYDRPIGTVTKELSQTFGGLELRGSALNVEVRCSWTSNSDDLSGQLEAWVQYLLQSAGLPVAHPSGLEVHHA